MLEEVNKHLIHCHSERVLSCKCQMVNICNLIFKDTGAQVHSHQSILPLNPVYHEIDARLGVTMKTPVPIFNIKNSILNTDNFNHIPLAKKAGFGPD